MQGKKIDKRKKAQIISAKLNNLDKSIRDIADEVGVGKSTVAETINNTAEIIKKMDSSDKARDLLDVNISILTKGKEIIEKEIDKISKGEGEVKIKSLNDIKTLSTTLEDAFKQNQLLGLKPTDIVSINGYKMLEEIKDGIKGKEDAYALLNKLKEDKE